jgi:hypothetical protein
MTFKAVGSRIHSGGSMKRRSNVSNRPSISARAALELSQVSQSVLDVFALIFFALFASLCGVSVAVSVFILLFVGF